MFHFLLFFVGVVFAAEFEDKLSSNYIKSGGAGQQQGLRVLPPFYGQNNFQQQGPYSEYKKPTKKVNNQELTSSEERELAEYEEEQKPDRLQELLKNSKFVCQGKKDGYYADDGLNCEVFHYCQDGGKHSWLCPNQFAFHQIHLICVPPSSDNICQKSPDYHFVNDYLYKVTNEKDAHKYNESLKYADRFFPDGYQSGGGELQPYNEQGEEFRPFPQQQFSREEQQQHQPQQQQQRFSHSQERFRQSHPQQSQSHPQQQQHQKPQVYFNPEMINIPLTHRRPVPGNFRPSTQVVRVKEY